ncbi:MAG: class I SAM-dependent methyltransferase [Acidobacteria bacterium]|nr:class I SAM-dependent methyltransferase [Acidobacteriota bacterium]
MGLYAKYIFPHLLDYLMGQPQISEYRRVALAGARGVTLEIGFGTGRNLPHYPNTVTRLVAIDSENMLRRKVAARIAASPLPVEQKQLDAQGRLPFADGAFDTVVTTLTLCSIGDVMAALAEMRRVLKSDGQFLFFEHGRSDDARVAARQDRFNPLQKIVGAGCNMNRPMDALIRQAGFEIAELERFVMPDAPRVLAEMYRGVAVSQR